MSNVQILDLHLYM